MCGINGEKDIHLDPSSTDFGTVDTWSSNFLELGAARRYSPSNFVDA